MTKILHLICYHSRKHFFGINFWKNIPERIIFRKLCSKKCFSRIYFMNSRKYVRKKSNLEVIFKRGKIVFFWIWCGVDRNLLGCKKKHPICYWNIGLMDNGKGVSSVISSWILKFKLCLCSIKWHWWCGFFERFYTYSCLWSALWTNLLEVWIEYWFPGFMVEWK